MKIPYYVVHSFTDKVGAGNPAGVCPLESWLPDPVMQQIAADNNLSETAFFVRENSIFRLRWFAPTAEVDLCGHATLAAAHVLFESLGCREEEITFATRSGLLKVRRSGGEYAMDFPALTLVPCEPPLPLLKGLARHPVEILRGMDYVAVYPTEEDVIAIAPDLTELRRLELRGVVVTAPGKGADYVCRCFGPKVGIAEDPVTGSIQCALAPYWAKRLGKTRLTVLQRSKRGGRMNCELKGDRVSIAGPAVLYLKGEILVP